jgi:DNA-binding IclR family transcriptional regulator
MKITEIKTTLLGLAKSTLHRLLRSLEAHRILRQDDEKQAGIFAITSLSGAI